MAPQVLLMPVYTRGNEIERLRGALSLATFLGAHLDVVYARSKPSDVLDNELFALPSSLRDHIVSIMDDDAHDEQAVVRSHFEELCAEANVTLSETPGVARPSASWRVFDGARSELVGLQGRVSDLVIIPHSKSGTATPTFEEAILHTGRPVLVVPRGMWYFSLGGVLIGWDGGLEASRAVQQALPFLKRASAVTIAAAATTVDETPTASALVTYLGAHGVTADVRVMRASSDAAGRQLLDMASELDCTFLVTGGYSHSRLRQSILGGVTSYLLNHAGIPVLMAH